MDNSNEPGGDPIEFPIENAFEHPLGHGNDNRPVLADLTNVLTPAAEETNVTIAHAEEEEKPSTAQPTQDAYEGTPYSIIQECFTPIDVVNVNEMQQNEAVADATPHHAALFALETELNSEDPMQEWPYAMDVFNYQKERESKFIIHDYMPSQVNLTAWNRTLLISWMVSVHQTFGTFRETLFLSVKIVDLYLCRFVVEDSLMQLLGAAALNIASKYEEKQSLSKDPLLDLCHWAYTTHDLVQIEQDILCGLNFDLGIPIGFRFLRRYARSANVPEPIWTLGSYILELNLMEYSTVVHPDSLLAAAALFMALRMCGGFAGELDEHTWNSALVYYSGYELPEFAWLVPKLNAVLHRSDCDSVKDVRAIYSTPMLYDVTNVPHLTNEEIFCHNPQLYMTY